MNALQGQYEKELLHVSDIVPNSDYLDHNICPDENFVWAYSPTHAHTRTCSLKLIEWIQFWAIKFVQKLFYFKCKSQLCKKQSFSNKIFSKNLVSIILWNTPFIVLFKDQTFRCSVFFALAGWNAFKKRRPDAPKPPSMLSLCMSPVSQQTSKAGNRFCGHSVDTSQKLALAKLFFSFGWTYLLYDHLIIPKQGTGHSLPRLCSSLVCNRSTPSSFSFSSSSSFPFSSSFCSSWVTFLFTLSNEKKPIVSIQVGSPINLQSAFFVSLRSKSKNTARHLPPTPTYLFALFLSAAKLTHSTQWTRSYPTHTHNTIHYLDDVGGSFCFKHQLYLFSKRFHLCVVVQSMKTRWSLSSAPASTVLFALLAAFWLFAV